jgi:hypothetical protein
MARVDTQAFGNRRHAYCIPDLVQLGKNDVRIRLDLTQPAHLAILRDRLDRTGAASLTEGEAEFGWIGGRPHEIVIPPRVQNITGPAVRRLVIGRPSPDRVTCRASFPGCTPSCTGIRNSRAILAHLAAGRDDRREQSLLLCTAMMRAAGLDLYEQGDVWAWVAEHRPPEPAHLPDPGIGGPFTTDIRRLLTGEPTNPS